MNTRCVTLASTALLAIVSAPQVGLAQDGLEEVVVTAQRRAERLQDIPVSVSAFSPAELERRNIVTTRDLIQYVPNLQGNNNTGLGTANVYFLRGLGNGESIATFDPPVGTYIDDIYLARQNMNDFGFFDVESIEVLRGPQGTLFGRNTSGGAINFKLRKPAEVLGGTAEIGYGRFNAVQARGVVDLPVNERWLTQVAGFYDEADGYVTNITTGQKLNGRRAWGARAAVRAKFSDTVAWDVAYNHLFADELNVLNFECRMFDSGVPTPAAPPNCRGRFAVTGLGEGPGGAPNTLTNIRINVPGTGLVPYTPARNLGSTPVGNRTSLDIVSSNVQIDFDHLSVNFITGYWELDQRYLFEFQDGRNGRSLAFPAPAVPVVLVGGVPSPNGFFVLANHAFSDAFSQEIKGTGDFYDGRVKYVAGAYYYRDNNDTDFADIVAGSVSGDRSLNNRTTSVAAYAQADLYVTPRLFATAGVRFTDERKTVGIVDNRPAAVAPVIGGVLRPDLRLTTSNLAARGLPTELNTDLWTPRFALNYKVEEDVLVFATATRGFRSGGWNVRGADISSFAPFVAEEVWTYEVGAKAEFFDRRLRTNLTVFDNDVSGLQLPSSFVQANGVPTFITQNAADLRVRGAELEVSARPLASLTTFLSVGYQDAEYRNIPAATVAQQAACRAAKVTGGVSGGAGTVCAVGIVRYDGSIADPARTPHWTIAAGASQEIRIGSSGWTLIPSANVSYQSAMESAVANLSFFSNAAGAVNVTGDGEFIAGSRTDPRVAVNASLALVSDAGRWRVTADCSNCFDEAWSESAVSGYSFINPPGTWSLRVRYAF
jgi:iron complex outermembrane receptor protein